MTDIGTSVPQAIGNALFGGSLSAGQIFISVIVLMMVLIPMMIWLNDKHVPPQLYLVLIIMITGMETAIGWLDQWIFVTIIFVICATFASYFIYGNKSSTGGAGGV